MEMKEYELAGIETIARGVCVRNGKVLLCRAKGGGSTYLPGGHIEFGETGRQALVREVREELGVESGTGAFLGAAENSFMQHGKPHAEINLVYELKIDAEDLKSQEDWIEFEWCDLGRLDEANLLPVAFRAISSWPDVRFEC
jgi:8-oxo-dGTP pyrophosphatase MutT (NUDIX family)